jgi:hypothetical protein
MMALNDSTLNATGSVWCRAYTADGFQVSLTLPASTAAEAAAQMDAIRAAGFLAAPSDATAGEIIETMTMCVRRETVNKHDDTVPVIDCYFNGGKFKWVTLYLDDDAQRAEFERQSGLTVSKMPLYASQAPLQAGERATMKYETPCPRPFVAVKVPAREKEVNGVKQMTYKFARYGGQPASALPVNEKAFSPRKPDTRLKPTPAGFTKETATVFTNHWYKTEMLAYEDILEALGVDNILKWAGTIEEAHAAVQMWCDANPPVQADAS